MTKPIRDLVVVHAGDESNHARWLPGGARDWDLFVCRDGRAARRPGLATGADAPGVVEIERAGPRWPTLGRLLADTREAWQAYGRVWLPADDLELEPGTIAQLFETCRQHALDLVVPEFPQGAPDSTAPLFSTRLLAAVLDSLSLPDATSMERRWAQIAAEAGARVARLDGLALRRGRRALDASGVVPPAPPAPTPATVPPVGDATPVPASPPTADERPARRAAAPAEPLISVLIPTFNRAAILQRCLAQLAAQSLPADRFEVIVVDDGSADETPQVLDEAARRHGVVALRQPNLGPAAARNLAMTRARAPWVLFLNDDALLEPQALSIHVDEHGRRGPKAAVLGSFWMHPEFIDLRRPLGHCLDHSDLVFDYPFMVAGRPYGHAHFYTCNLSVAREFVQRHGGFDDGFVRMGAEDIELGMRLEEDGCEVYYRPDAVARHAHRLDAAGLARMYRFRGRGGVHLFRRHLEFRPHYAALAPERRATLLALDARLQPLLQHLDEAIARHDVQALRHGGVRTRFNPGATGVDFSPLWSWPDAQIERVLRQLVASLAPSASAAMATLPQAAARVYPALQFVKWYHDTMGVAGSDELLPYLDEIARHGAEACANAA